MTNRILKYLIDSKEDNRQFDKVLKFIKLEYRQQVTRKIRNRLLQYDGNLHEMGNDINELLLINATSHADSNNPILLIRDKLTGNTITTSSPTPLRDAYINAYPMGNVLFPNIVVYLFGTISGDIVISSKFLIQFNKYLMWLRCETLRLYKRRIRART